MKNEKKILAGGLTLAAVVWAAGTWNEHRLERQLASIVSECEAGNATRHASAIPPPPPGYSLDKPMAAKAVKPISAEEVLAGAPSPVQPSPFDQFADWVCDPDALLKTPNPVGVQKRITDTHVASRRATSDTNPLAIAIAGLSIIPWLWYFLLRRIVELRNAIGGKAP
jgi:hypothetical protein